VAIPHDCNTVANPLGLPPHGFMYQKVHKKCTNHSLDPRPIYSRASAKVTRASPDAAGRFVASHLELDQEAYDA